MLVMSVMSADILAARASKLALRHTAKPTDLAALDAAEKRQREAWAAYDAEVERVRAAADGLLGFDV